MFDKVVLNGQSGTHHHQHNTSVIEKRAPTDESVKLLQEMQQKAFDSVFLQYRVDTNVVNGMVSYILNDFEIPFATIILWHFNLNGEQYEIKEEFKEIEAKMKGKEFAMRSLFEKVANKLAEQMMQNAIENETVVKELIKK